MRNITKYAITPRSTIKDSIVSEWTRWNMYTGSGSVLVNDNPIAASGLQDMAIAGTLTNVWDNTGWFTPLPGAAGADQGHYARSVDGTEDAFFRADNLVGVGGHLLWADIFIAASPGGGLQEYLIQYGGRSNCYYALTVTYGANLNLQALVQPLGGSIINAQVAVQAFINQRISFAAFFDWKNSTVTPYANGVAGTSLAIGAGDLPGPATTSRVGLTLLARNHATASSSDVRFGDLVATTTPRISNLGGIRFDTDKSSIVPALVSDLYKFRGEFGPNFEGV